MELKSGEKKVNRNEERRDFWQFRRRRECDANVTDCVRISNVLEHQKLHSSYHASHTPLFTYFLIGWSVGQFVLKFVLSDWPIC